MEWFILVIAALQVIIVLYIFHHKDRKQDRNAAENKDSSDVAQNNSRDNIETSLNRTFKEKLKYFITLRKTRNVWAALNEKERNRWGIIFWCSVTLAIIVILNAIFYFFEDWKLEAFSPLSYENTVLLLGSVLPAVVIAMVQFRINKNLEAKNDQLVKLEEKQHEKELQAKELRILESLGQLTGEAANLLLVQSHGQIEYHKINGFSYYIKLYLPDHANIFPAYFNYKIRRLHITQRKTDDAYVFDRFEHYGMKEQQSKNDDGCVEFYQNEIRIYLKEDKIENFFIIPALGKYFGRDPTDALEGMLEVDIKDSSISLSGTEFLAFKIRITFELVPYFGYNVTGRFPVIARNLQLELI